MFTNIAHLKFQFITIFRQCAMRKISLVQNVTYVCNISDKCIPNYGLSIARAEMLRE